VVLRDELKYIEGDEHFGDREGLLFDLSADPRERSNLRASKGAEFAALAAEARAWEQALVRHPPVHQQTGDPLAPEGPAAGPPRGSP
jgi:hypothetical protein